MSQFRKTVRAVKVSHKVTVRNGSKSRTVERSRVRRHERITKSDPAIEVTLPEVPRIPAEQRGTSYAISSHEGGGQPEARQEQRGRFHLPHVRPDSVPFH
jgi:hypothetical protein